jgi:hypothetical protein
MLNRFEAFNLSMMSKMQNRRAQAAVPMISSVSAKAVPGPSQSHSGGQDVAMADVSVSTSNVQQGAGGTSGTGGPAAAKKKKPKKKK